MKPRKLQIGANLINDSWNKILMTYLDMSPAKKKVNGDGWKNQSNNKKT